jgi:signal transduction histidine kinase
MDELELRRVARRIVESDRELVVLNERLLEASRNKSEFLARMSHELRTPLNAIMGASELLQAGLWGELTEKQQEYIGHIRAGGDHLLSLINDVLDISKVESGKEELHLEPVSLQALLQSCAATARAAGAPKELTLALEQPEPDVIFEADERKLKQVLLNVLSNATKFSPPGGRVGLSARVRGEEIMFSIEDGGPGVPAEFRDRIFEEFFRVDDRASRSQPGTGLGLAVAKRLIELHHGRIWLDASGPEGSCFCLTVPMTLRPE